MTNGDDLEQVAQRLPVQRFTGPTVAGSKPELGSIGVAASN